MRLKSRVKDDNTTCNEDEFCVQLYSRSASLVHEFCLDKEQNGIADISAAKGLLRQTMAPCDFASTTVTLISDEGTSEESVLQFDPKPI